MLKTVRARFKNVGAPAWPMANLLVFWGGTINGFNAFEHNPESYAEHITSPVLLMHGVDDPKVSAAEIDAIFSRLKGPKQRITFSKTGHANYLLHNRESWTQSVDSFLSRI